MLLMALILSLNCCHGPLFPPPPYPPRPLPRPKYGLIARLTLPVVKALACATPFHPGRACAGRREGAKDELRKEERRARKGEEGRGRWAVEEAKEGVKSPLVVRERLGVK
jgi:hypothetical protein